MARTIIIAVTTALTVIALLVGASGVLAAALYFYLLSLPLSRPVAALIVGLAMLLGVALLVITAMRLAAGPPALRRRRRRAGPGGSDVGRAAAEFGSRVAREVEGATNAHPYGAAALAFLAGLALGSNPQAQEIIKTALRASDSR